MAMAISLIPSFTQAQPFTRTWVSGVGDDANSGIRYAPCKTFQGAIAKTTAGGIITVLDPGGFGAVTITKSITIEGDGAEASILVSGTHGIIVNIPNAGSSDVVILRNLTIKGIGPSLSGINIISAGAVHIENCRIDGFPTSSGINFVCTVSNAQLFVKNTTIHDCLPAGIELAPTVPSSALIDKANITVCSNGIDASANSKCTVANTTVSGNTGAGFSVGSNSRLTIKTCVSTDNKIGVQSAGIASLFGSEIVHNSGLGLKMTGGGQIISFKNNLIQGNHPDGSPTMVLTGN